MAIVVTVDKYDSSDTSHSFNTPCSTDWERPSISIGQPCSRFDKPYTEVQWEMLEIMDSMRKVVTEVMTIEQACETVDANLLTGSSGCNYVQAFLNTIK